MRQTKVTSLLTGLVIVLFVLLLGPARAAAQGVIVDVHIFNFDFGTAAGTPFDPTIHVGDTVHWIWDSGFHSTTSAAGQLESWDSGTHSPAFSYDHTFTHEGTFNYYCVIHGFDAGGGNVGGMSGHVTVLPVPEPATAGLFVIALGAFFASRSRFSKQS